MLDKILLKCHFKSIRNHKVKMVNSKTLKVILMLNETQT